MTKSVLVTGASSGIGLATACHLAESGYRVFAGVRRFSQSPHASVREILLDVTKPESIENARAEIESDLAGSGLDALVNNAGVGDISPIEFTSPQKFRDVFEVNVFGVIAVTQAFLPLLRQARGRIVNIGSVGGLITIPFGSALCASKHAIEAISDSMRLELFPSGIHVTVVQPASINSGAAEKLAAQTEHTISSLPPEGQSRYAAILREFTQTMVKAETSGSPPSAVAEVVLHCLESHSPPSRILAGKDGHLLSFLGRFVPDSLRDILLRKALLSDHAK